jgi:hypothetical protein
VADEKYRYKVDVSAREYFANFLQKWGINVGLAQGAVEFESDTKLDMKSLRAKGIISSYEIARLITSFEVVEKG